MLNKLKKIPAVRHLRISPDSSTLLMRIDDRTARGYLCLLSLVLSIFIDNIDAFPFKTVRYITLLLAASPENHDYSLQLMPEGGWLCCYYDKNLPTEKIAIELEKHLALTRYLSSIINSGKSSKM